MLRVTISKALERGSAGYTKLPGITDNVLDWDELVVPHLPKCSNRRLNRGKWKNDGLDKTNLTAKAHCIKKELDAYDRSGMLKATLFAIDKTTFLEYMVALEKSKIFKFYKCDT